MKPSLHGLSFKFALELKTCPITKQVIPLLESQTQNKYDKEFVNKLKGQIDGSRRV